MPDGRDNYLKAALREDTPIPAGAIVFCKYCGAELWRTRINIYEGTLISLQQFDAWKGWPVADRNTPYPCPECLFRDQPISFPYKWRMPTEDELREHRQRA